MTDERQAGETQMPPADPDQPAPAAAPAEASPPGEPAPLAPLVDQARSGATGQLDDTTAQPTGSWPAPPPIPPPAVQPGAAWGPPSAAAPVPGQRTGLAMAAGITLIVLGILGGIAGLALATVGRGIVDAIGEFGPIPGMEGVDTETFVSGFILFFAIIILVYSFVYLIAGVGVLRNRDWARILGIVVGIVSGLVWLGGLGGGRRGGGGDLGGTLLLLGAHVFIVVALAFFWRTRATSA